MEQEISEFPLTFPEKRRTSRGWPKFSKRIAESNVPFDFELKIFGNFGRMERALFFLTTELMQLFCRRGKAVGCSASVGGTTWWLFLFRLLPQKHQSYSSEVIGLHVNIRVITKWHDTVASWLFRLINNYSPKRRWIVVDIHQAAKQRGKYPPLSPTLRLIIVLVHTTQAWRSIPRPLIRKARMRFRAQTAICDWRRKKITKGIFSLTLGSPFGKPK